MSAAPSDFPLQAAIRMFLDDVSYSSALPEWFDALTILYTTRETNLRRRIAEYEAGQSPKAPFRIVVPKRNGKSNNWTSPSINDQILMQTCVLAISKPVDKAVDRTHVYSYALNSDPNRVTLIEDSVDAWKRFRAAVQSRCNSDNCMLQIDLKDAFGSIKLVAFFQFLRSAAGSSRAVALLERLLKAFSLPDEGLPFINDSIFFLGNAYLSKADAIIRAHTPNFVRFADDYKIFGASVPQLEAMLPSIRTGLAKIGFEINDGKTKLGAGEAFLDAVANTGRATTQKTEYVPATTQHGLVNAADMYKLVASAVADPDQFLHQGFGRLQLGAIRRMRARALLTDMQNLGDSPAEQLSAAIFGDNALVERICDLLERYSTDDSNAWRLIWLLYLCKNGASAARTDDPLRQRLRGLIAAINRSDKVSPVCRLWAAPMPGFPAPKIAPAEIEVLHGLEYVERGRRCYDG